MIFYLIILTFYLIIMTFYIIIMSFRFTTGKVWLSQLHFHLFCSLLWKKWASILKQLHLLFFILPREFSTTISLPVIEGNEPVLLHCCAWSERQWEACGCVGWGQDVEVSQFRNRTVGNDCADAEICPFMAPGHYVFFFFF